MGRWSEKEGTPLPLGAHFVPEEGAWNFALYSKHATAVTLNLYASHDAVNPLHRQRFDPLRHKSGRVWHCRVPERIAAPARYYAYQADGPHDPAQGQRFDREKILLDPYARAVHFPRGTSREAASRPGGNAGRAPLGILAPDRLPFDWRGDRRPRHEHDAVVYELHVKGFTAHPSSGVAPERRGSFAGLVDKIPHLRALGVTVVELMPVFQTDPGEGNYWGNSPLSFFALHHAYCSCRAEGGELHELRELVRALHEADIEVVLDVVYNHTTEQDAWGPTYSLRGIDNTTYYLLCDDRSRYRNDSGTGNVLHTANRFVRQLVLDSLRFWAREMRVDGFRFDLASLFTRSADGSVNLNDPPIVSEISGDPDLADLRLIAEAWDVSTYQLGRSFPGIQWLQWNGRFRDDLRAFVRGDPGRVPDLMRRLYGSDDLFPDSRMDAYRPYQSLNYVDCHDGFTLYDLLSYDHKHNEANGHENRDGMDENLSWNCGHEGDAGAPEEVLALRARQARNFCCLLLLANGTPMFRAGDEFLQTQGGNNNPYNQDNPTTWLDWSRLEAHRDVFRFFQRMIEFRKHHPSIARGRFWREDVSWHGVGPEPDLGRDSHSLAYHLRGASEDDTDLYVLINAWWEDLVFELQAPGPWARAVDTALPSPEDIADPGREAPVRDGRYPARARSVVVLVKPRSAGSG